MAERSSPIQEVRDLTRARRQLGRQIAQHTLRPQKTLEDANLRIASFVSDLPGVSGRAILRGLIQGETSPDRLPARTTGLLRARPDQFQAELEGQVRDHQQFLLRLHLVAVAASLLTSVYFVLRDDVVVVYRDLGAHDFDRHDATRAAARLTRRLEALGFKVALSAAWIGGKA